MHKIDVKLAGLDHEAIHFKLCGVVNGTICVQCVRNSGNYGPI